MNILYNWSLLSDKIKDIWLPALIPLIAFFLVCLIIAVIRKNKLD